MTGSLRFTNYLLPGASAALNFTISGNAAPLFLVPIWPPTVTSSANFFAIRQTQVRFDDQPLRWGVLTVTPTAAAQPGYNLTLDITLASTLPSNESVNFSATRLVWPGSAFNTITVNLTTTGVSFEFVTLNFTVSGVPGQTWATPRPYPFYFSYVNITSITNGGINETYVYTSLTWTVNLTRPPPSGRTVCAGLSWRAASTSSCTSSQILSLNFSLTRWAIRRRRFPSTPRTCTSGIASLPVW
jgi:hypothetical protein